MECGFLSQKGSWGGGRGVKDKNVNVSNIKAVKEKDSNDEPVVMKEQSPLVDQTNAVKQAVNIRTLFTSRREWIDVVVSMESIQAISKRFVNTAYGFFLGKRVAYPVVANYVRNNRDGLNSMLENGPWVIRNHPLILRKWNPNIDLLKEDVGNVPVWVKLYGGPVTAFSEDGLSAIAIKLVMIILWVDVELKDTIMVAMPKIIAEGYYTCIVRVKYECKPPSCSCCKVFGYTQEECPKNIGLGVAKNLKKPNQTS
nr:hypothetical protein [Tanacetum cinerariifolium]